MKYSNLIGIAACLILIMACFLPWAYYPDLGKTFNGFYSEGNAYGRPGRTFLFFGVLSAALFLIPRIWAKRVNLLVAAICIAYSIKTFVLFTACYEGTCPVKKAGIFLLMFASVTVLIAAVLPDLKLRSRENKL